MGRGQIKAHFLVAFRAFEHLVLEARRSFADVMDASEPGHERFSSLVATRDDAGDILLHRIRKPFIPDFPSDAR